MLEAPSPFSNSPLFCLAVTCALQGTMLRHRRGHRRGSPRHRRWHRPATLWQPIPTAKTADLRALAEANLLHARCSLAASGRGGCAGVPHCSATDTGGTAPQALLATGGQSTSWAPGVEVAYARLLFLGRPPLSHQGCVALRGPVGCTKDSWQPPGAEFVTSDRSKITPTDLTNESPKQVRISRPSLIAKGSPKPFINSFAVPREALNVWGFVESLRGIASMCGEVV